MSRFHTVGLLAIYPQLVNLSSQVRTIFCESLILDLSVSKYVLQLEPNGLDWNHESSLSIALHHVHGYQECELVVTVADRQANVSAL